MTTTPQDPNIPTNLKERKDYIYSQAIKKQCRVISIENINNLKSRVFYPGRRPG